MAARSLDNLDDNPDGNPYAGAPIDADDAAIVRLLEDVSVPAMLCSLVHMTGDPSWLRSAIRPQVSILNDYQGGMPNEMQAQARALALPVIARYRDEGANPQPLSAEIVREMMEFVACAPLSDADAEMFLDDLQLDGADRHAVAWGDTVPANALAANDVIVIGCGESGLLAALRLAQAGLPFTVIEKNAGPGGTWWDNRYPGARVDIGSHFYCYSFEPSDHWTEYFAQHPELREYFATTLDTYQLRQHCRFETEVLSAEFDESTQRWNVAVRRNGGPQETLSARFIISAVGALNQPNIPDIAGLGDFDGPLFHSARWDHSVDITGVRFGLIGAGASGFQIAPTIADQVEHLTVFQRTAQWMLPNMNYHRTVPEGDRWAMRHLPFYGRWFRFLTFYPGSGINIGWTRLDPTYDDPTGQAISEVNALRREQFGGWITSQLSERPDLIEKCIPDYPPSAKRMLQDNGSWLTCLKKPNVELVRAGIERIVPNGVVTVDGELHELDVICLATGFRHNDFLWPIEFIGRDGESLRERWGNEPTAFLGITVPDFPNLFCLYGPGTNLAHGASLIFQSESQVNYIMSAIHTTLAGGYHSIEVTEQAHDQYAERYQTEIAQTVWAHWRVRHSHFKNADGKVFTLSPWSIAEYWRWMRQLDPDDYVFDSWNTASRPA